MRKPELQRVMILLACEFAGQHGGGNPRKSLLIAAQDGVLQQGKRIASSPAADQATRTEPGAPTRVSNRDHGAAER